MIDNHTVPFIVNLQACNNARSEFTLKVHTVDFSFSMQGEKSEIK